MQALLANVGATVAGILMSMGAQLMTERFIKRLIVKGLEILVKKTETDVDDQLLRDAKQAWGLPE